LEAWTGARVQNGIEQGVQLRSYVDGDLAAELDQPVDLGTGKPEVPFLERFLRSWFDPVLVQPLAPLPGLDGDQVS
jgi:hypothetical protein